MKVNPNYKLANECVLKPGQIIAICLLHWPEWRSPGPSLAKIKIDAGELLADCYECDSTMTRPSQRAESRVKLRVKRVESQVKSQVRKKVHRQKHDRHMSANKTAMDK